MKTSVSHKATLFGKSLVRAGLIAAWAASLPVAAQDESDSDFPGGTFAEPSRMAEAVPEAKPAGRERAKIPVRLSEMFEAGGPLMYPIALCSVIVVAFSVERQVVLRRRRAIP